MEPIFDFSFQNLTGFLISFIPAVINLALVGYVFIKLPRNNVTSVFALLTLAMAFWQINDSISRIAKSETTTDIWDCIFSAAWIMVGALCLHFTILYSRILNANYTRAILYLVYTPGFLFMGLYQSHIYPHQFRYDGFWGWVNYHDKSLLDEIMIYWISVQVLVGTSLLVYRSYMTRHERLLRSQSLLILFGIAVPAVAGIITQVYFPIVLHQPAIPVSSTFMTCFTLSTVIALREYKLFTISDLVNNETLIESVPVVVLGISADKTVNYINSFGTKLFGISNKKVLYRKFNEVIQFGTQEHKESFERALNSALDGDSLMGIESSVVTGNGVIDILVSSNPIINNHKIEGALFSIRNITELKNSHKRIVKNEAMLREAQELAHIGSWEWDVRTNQVTWSDELYRIYGYTPGEMSVDYDLFLRLVHPQDRERVNEIITRAYTDHQSFDFYHRIIRKDGTEKMVQAHGTVTTEGKDTIKMTGTGQDVTKQKADEALLLAQNKELQKINSELDKFVYSVSHDLRSPLTSMLGLIMIMEGETQDPVVLEYLGMLKKSVEKQDKFIMDILDYSRNARTEIDYRDVDVKEVIQDIRQHLRFMQPDFEKVKLLVTVNNGVAFRSDRTRLYIILNNLMSNAIRYYDRGAESPYLHISADITKETAKLTVTDNGMGITKEDQEKVFAMFYRGTSISQGSGLGLYIVQDAVQRMGGSISLESEPGKGTRFIIDLPNYSAELILADAI
jgi:PAS domain S-box-containing protein